MSCMLRPLLALSFALRLASAILPPARWGGGCAYALQRIYCFGGSTWSFSTGVDASHSLNDFIYLDVAESFTVSSSSSAWVEANVNGTLRAEANFMFALTSIPGNDTIIINGGVGAQNGNLLVYPTIAYNARAETWTSVSGSGGLQTYMHSMTATEDGMVYVWGGVSDAATGYVGQEYPRNMRVLDYNANQWSTVMLPNMYPSRLYQQSVLGNDQATIYFLGGNIERQYTDDNGTTQYEAQDALFSEILTFNIRTALWSTRNATGDYIPTPRVLHSAAPKPNSNEIVVYGGTYTNISLGAVPDFCAVLDTTSMTWRNINLSTSAGAGARFGHSAVFPEGSSKMFILFGIDSNVHERTDFQVLDTDTWTWIDNYVGPGRKDDGSGDQGPHGDSGGGGGVSGGTIAGIVVGVVAGVAIIAGVFFFFLRRRRNDRSNTHTREKDGHPQFLVDVSDHGPSSPPPRYDDQTAPAIFQHHSLTPSPAGHQRTSSASSNNAQLTGAGYSATSSDRVSSEGRRSFGLESGKPDAHDGAIRLTMQPVKPDGGN
ncbi:hypothetical protein BJV82DRAFT_652310 [Fennellomyces sp. T-0311]|nr:hypothetical protein BJV82DRAFT_652310 [Fennellomyces sp. T-0311]